MISVRERGGTKRILLNWKRDWNLSFVARFVVSNLAEAGVAELADALDSKSSDRKIVWVRAPPPADSWTLGFDAPGSSTDQSRRHKTGYYISDDHLFHGFVRNK